MKLDDIKKKWNGVQSVWKEGCYLFAILTILDEKGIPYDLWEVTHELIEKGLMREDGYIQDACGVLYALTNEHFTASFVKEVPIMSRNMYSIEKWYNERTGFTHFRRRFVDTLKDSVTVKEGKLLGYYIFKEVGI